MTPQAVYEKFAKQEGAQHIAGLIALEKINQILQEEKPKRILEVGTGLGTITYLMLANSNATIDTYEPNEYCITRAKENLAEFNNRYNLITNINLLPPHRDYDLVIVDGGAGSPDDYGYLRLVYIYLLSLNSVKTVVVEGHRAEQNAFIRRALLEKYIYKKTRYNIQHGVTIYYLKSTKNKFKRYWCYLTNR